MALFLQVAPRLFSAHFRSLLTLAPNNTLESFVASVLYRGSGTEAVCKTVTASFFLRLGMAPAEKFLFSYRARRPRSVEIF
jgi:hypothetical protein